MCAANGGSAPTSVGAGMGNSWCCASECAAELRHPCVIWPAIISDDEPPNCQENDGNKATPVSGDAALM